MSKRLQVLQAVKALAVAALPNADVEGLNAADAKPDRIGPGGTVIVRAGDPGDPVGVDLNPVLYYFDHAIPLEFAAFESASLSSEEVLDGMMGAFGLALAADRTLGGLCDWIEALAPTTDDFDTAGALAGRWADLLVVASYATPDPLN